MKKHDQDWLEERRYEVDVEMDRLKERINAVFEQMVERRTEGGRRRIDKLAGIIGKVIRPSPRLGRRQR